MSNYYIKYNYITKNIFIVLLKLELTYVITPFVQYLNKATIHFLVLVMLDNHVIDMIILMIVIIVIHLHSY